MAVTMGVGYTEFKHLNPYKLSLMQKGFKEGRKIRDREMWMWFGTYGREAITIGVKNGVWGQGKLEYSKTPILSDIEQETKNGYKESKEEVAMFEMQQRINLLRKSGLPESPD